MVVYEDKAIRKRKCHMCDGVIEAGEPCLYFTSSGMYGSTTANNVCKRCISGMCVEWSL